MQENNSIVRILLLLSTFISFQTQVYSALGEYNLNQVSIQGTNLLKLYSIQYRVTVLLESVDSKLTLVLQVRLESLHKLCNHRSYYLLSDENPNGVISACSESRAGQDDLPTFDLIRKFKLDNIDLEFQGVKRVRGSNRIQTAYRLTRKAELTLPTRF